MIIEKFPIADEVFVTPDNDDIKPFTLRKNAWDNRKKIEHLIEFDYIEFSFITRANILYFDFLKSSSSVYLILEYLENL